MGEPLDGPHITAVRALAKALNMAVVCPMRLTVGRTTAVNAAVLIHSNGSIAKAAFTGP